MSKFSERLREINGMNLTAREWGKEISEAVKLMTFDEFVDSARAFGWNIDKLLEVGKDASLTYDEMMALTVGPIRLA